MTSVTYMIHHPTGIEISVEKNSLGETRFFVEISGTFASIGTTKRERMSLAKFFREAADALEREPKATSPRKKNR